MSPVPVKSAVPVDPAWAADIVTTARWLSKVAPQPNGCIYWTASLTAEGYGRFSVHYRATGAHRVAWIAANGRDTPSGVYVGHRCHDEAYERGECSGRCAHRRCVNPDHLYLQTHSENSHTERGTAALTARTHCPRGHRYTDDNILPSERGTTRRSCLRCKREAHEFIAEAAQLLGLEQRDYIAAHTSARAQAEVIVASYGKTDYVLSLVDAKWGPAPY